MDTVKWYELEKWHQEHPDVKTVMVDHEEFGYAQLVFNYSNPSDNLNVFKYGQYDSFGNFHFIDDKGTYHICYKPRIIKNRNFIKESIERRYGTTGKKKYN